MTALRVLIAGGGTGGHLYPGIAVARELQRRDASIVVTFVGTTSGLESRVLPREGLVLDTIRVAGLKGKSLVALVRGLLTLPLSALDAWRVLSTRRPSVVVGVGGYASGPVVALAALRRMPTMLLEQNALPGVTNRLLAPWVRAAAVNFADALQFFPRVGFVAGNPVRARFFEAPPATPVNGPQVRVLVFGGSQGAQAINRAMVEAAPLLAASGVAVQVTHQTGTRDHADVVVGYARSALTARVEPFLYDMDQAMRDADLVVCRAGATTLSELAASGRAAILVPLPTATDDHQRKNAEAFARDGAAVVIEQSTLTGARMAEAVLALATDAPRRAAMSARARALAHADAASRIADQVVALAG
jgi:UDP-N-acetylglucosamine--N-acetylmuramyl-(pentapeptide) pyrophosphoryl-undecaprenol N-acetylglucosamine transferase